MAQQFNPSEMVVVHETKEEGALPTEPTMAPPKKSNSLPYPKTSCFSSSNPPVFPLPAPLLKANSRVLLARGASMRGGFGIGNNKEMLPVGPEELMAKVKRLMEEHQKELLRLREDEVRRQLWWW